MVLLYRKAATCALILAIPASMRHGLRLVSSTVNTGQITRAGNTSVARFDHAAALLPNGRVLIVGGISRNGEAEPTAELYDPATRQFLPAATPQVKRGWGPVAVALRNGKVLIVGGADARCADCLLDAAEIYDPVTGRFSLAPRMNAKRAGARALLLANGDVLIVGGNVDVSPDSARAESAPPDQAELYHPSSGSFTLTAPMHIPHPAQLISLRDGHVLVVGPSGAEVYDPIRKAFTLTGAMTRPRTKFGAAPLPDGRVLIVGGQTGGPWGRREDTTEIYDPAGGRFSPGPRLNERRFKLARAVVALKDGRVLIAGGAERPEIYDPTRKRFELVPGDALDGFCFSTATLLADSRVLLVGGYAKPGASGVNHAWIYEP